jgi:hypothetical protein
MESNKAFIHKLVSDRLSLMDYPEKICPDMALYEPALLPFGGTYLGIPAYKDLGPQVMAYYDYEKFELLGVFADGDMVFVNLNVGLKDSDKLVSLCEQFSFKGEKVAEIKIFVFNEL